VVKTAHGLKEAWPAPPKKPAKKNTKKAAKKKPPVRKASANPKTAAKKNAIIGAGISAIKQLVAGQHLTGKTISCWYEEADGKLKLYNGVVMHMANTTTDMAEESKKLLGSEFAMVSFAADKSKVWVECTADKLNTRTAGGWAFTEETLRSASVCC
jgi:hypothetical protein